MNYFLVGKKKRRYSCPSAWAELTGEQLAEVAEVLHSGAVKGEALTRIFFSLVRMRKECRLRLWWLWSISLEDKYDLMRLAKWVLEEPYKQTVNRLPTVLHGGVVLHGPLAGCQGFSFIEFIEADMAYLAFRTASDDAARHWELNRLFGILYRKRNKDVSKDGKEYPENWNGDMRCAYNTNLVEHNTLAVLEVDDKYKYAAVMFFAACHTAWEEAFPLIFKKPEAGETSNGGNWSGALKALAGGSINIDRMMAVNAVAALSDLNDRIEESERSKDSRASTGSA